MAGSSRCAANGVLLSDLKMAHWTGTFGMACVVLWLSQFPLYLTGSPPSVYDGTAFGQHLFAIKNIALTRVDYTGFYNAGGWGAAIIANFPPAIWFLVASISFIRTREAIAATPAGRA